MSLEPTFATRASVEGADIAPLHVLIEVWSADLRRGATNDPLDLAEYGRASALRVTLCGPDSIEFTARAREAGAGWVKHTSVAYGRRDLPRYVFSVLMGMRLLRRVRPDLLHVNYAGWGPSLACAAHLLRIPVAARPGEFNRANPGNGWTDGYVAITPAHAASVLSSGRAADVRVVGPFVSLGRLAAVRCGQVPPRVGSGCRFLFLGQLVPRKGLDVLLEAFALAAIDGELLLVGGDWSEPGYPAELRQIVERLGLADRVVLANHRPDAGALLEEADAFVLPSRGEAIPRCVLEAMILGTPVIATRVGGIPTIVRDRDTGLLVMPGSVEDLARALRIVASDARLRRRLASTAQAWARKEVDPTATARRYVDAYRGIIAAAQGRARRVRSPR